MHIFSRIKPINLVMLWVIIFSLWLIEPGRACSSREDPVEELEKQGNIVNGGIGWRLRFILAERCKRGLPFQ